MKDNFHFMLTIQHEFTNFRQFYDRALAPVSFVFSLSDDDDDDDDDGCYEDQLAVSHDCYGVVTAQWR